MTPMEDSPAPRPDWTRLLALKRHEVPPPGFSDYLRGRIMRQIAAERELAALPWWERIWSQVTWQRGMVAANALALAGVAVLGVATFQVAHSVANEELEGQVYVALPLPPEVLTRAAQRAIAQTSGEPPGPLLRPLPSRGDAAPIQVSFVDDPELESTATKDAPKWLFNTPSVSNRQFIMANDRLDRR